MKILTIIIINYNVRDFLMNTLESIQKAVFTISHEIIIVDVIQGENEPEVVGLAPDGL